MESMINKDFDNLSQRCVYYFLVTYPSFYPVKSDKADESEQKAAYDFILNIYKNLYDDPMLLKIKPVPDDALNEWQPQKEKPGLAPKLRGIIKKINGFIKQFHQDISDGTPINKNILCLAGENIPIHGLKLLAEISKDNYIYFSRGIFDPAAPWTREVFGNMFENRDAFDKLLDFIETNHYTRVDNKDLNHGISLDYIKNYGSPDDMLKWAWAERTRGGIEIVYEEILKNQPLLTMRIPYFAEILKNADKMNERVRNFIISQSKKCDNCRYCVQTDKTGKRPLSFISVGEKQICPLFCGFQYRWKILENETVENIIAMLEFIDELFAKKNI